LLFFFFLSDTGRLSLTATGTTTFVDTYR